MNFKAKKCHFLIVTMGLFLLTSCDPILDLSIEVFNNTSEKVVVEFKALHDQNKDTSFTMDIGQKVTLYSKSKWGKAKHFDCCSREFDSLKVITIDSTKTAVKNFKNEDNWLIENDKKKVKCTVIINNDDLK
ncbi:hypothetical protein CW751_00605 [Brumimicrobium salinarum]|uniref:Lipoprotein n=1 Tax=Brumimicrobium salinarum TaxID=2058658 RepID=A0A2I0R5K6_9FLAO|nr:hypothetical protein [Brumimicrobium salinarum]PKR81871.1 hypothetical protein CW751_00605 [Brumimicrobium salinarum]